jgi:hypothetical protein
MCSSLEHHSPNLFSQEFEKYLALVCTVSRVFLVYCIEPQHFQ